MIDLLCVSSVGITKLAKDAAPPPAIAINWGINRTAQQQGQGDYRCKPNGQLCEKVTTSPSKPRWQLGFG